MNYRISVLGTVLASVLWLNACAIPPWVNNVESDGEAAAAIAESLTDVIDPALAPLVTLIGNGFIALADTVDIFKKSPTATNLQAVQSAFAAVNANVAQLESAAQIKSLASQDKVASIVQLLAQTVTEIAAAVPKNEGLGVRDSGLGTANSRTSKGWKAKDLKREFNSIVKGDARFKELK